MTPFSTAMFIDGTGSAPVPSMRRTLRIREFIATSSVPVPWGLRTNQERMRSPYSFTALSHRIFFLASSEIGWASSEGSALSGSGASTCG